MGFELPVARQASCASAPPRLLDSHLVCRCSQPRHGGDTSRSRRDAATGLRLGDGQRRDGGVLISNVDIIIRLRASFATPISRSLLRLGAIYASLGRRCLILLFADFDDAMLHDACAKIRAMLTIYFARDEDEPAARRNDSQPRCLFKVIALRPIAIILQDKCQAELGATRHAEAEHAGMLATHLPGRAAITAQGSPGRAEAE